MTSPTMVGSAYVALRAVTEQLRKDIRDAVEEAFKETEPLTAAAGERAGKAYADGFKTGLVSGDLSRAIDGVFGDLETRSGQSGRDAGEQYGRQYRSQLNSQMRSAVADTEQIEKEAESRRAARQRGLPAPPVLQQPSPDTAREQRASRPSTSRTSAAGPAFDDISATGTKHIQLTAGLIDFQDEVDKASAYQPRNEPKIRVGADLDDFQKDLLAKLAALQKSAGVRIPLTAEGESLRQQTTTDISTIAAGVSRPLPSDPGAAARQRVQLADMVKGAQQTLEENIHAVGGIPVEANMDSFQKNLLQKLQQLQKSGELRIPLTADGEELRKQLRSAVADASESIKVPLPSDSGAAAEARLSMQKLVSTTGSDFEKNLKRAGGAPQSGDTVESANAAQRALRAVTDAAPGLGAIMSSLQGITVAAAAALAPLAATAVSGQIIGVVGALSQMTGALALVPAMAAAAGAGLATVKLATSGLSEAFSAYAATQKDAGEQTYQFNQQVKSLQEAAVSAQQGVVSSIHSLSDAQFNETQAEQQAKIATEDLTEARKAAQFQLEDLNLQLKGNSLTVEEANLRIIEAKQNLDKVMATPGSTAVQREEADLQYRQSLQNMDETKQKSKELQDQVATANQKGVDGAKSVVSAQNSVDSANHAVADSQFAVVQAQQALTKAVQDSARAQEDLNHTLQTGNPATKAYNEALAKLAPNARDFVTQIVSLHGAFKDMQQTVQNNFFAGLGQQVVTLANVQLPVLKTGLGDIATTFNGIVKDIAGGFSTPEAAAQFQAVLANINKMFQSMRPGIDALVDAFKTLTSVGSTFLPQLGAGFTDVSKKFDDFVQKGAKSGGLASSIQTGIDTIKLFGGILGNVAGILKDVFGAGAQYGQQLLGTLKDLTGSAKTFLDSAQGKAELADFFKNVSIAAQDLKGPLTAIGDAVRVLAPELLTLAEHAAPGVTALFNGLTSGLKELQPSAAPLGDTIGNVARLAGTLLDQFGRIANVVVTAVQPVIKPLTDGLGSISKTVGDIVVQAGPDLSRVFQDVSKIIPPVVNEIKKFLDSSKPYIEEMIHLAQDVLPPIVTVLKGVLDVAKPLTPVIIALGVAYVGLKAALTGLNFLVALPGNVASGFSTLKDKVTDATTAIQNMPGKAKEAANSVKTGMKDAATEAGGLSKAVGGFGALVAGGLAGPLGLAVAGITTAISLFADAHQRAADAAKAQQQQEQALQDTLDKSTGKVTQQTIEKAAGELQQGGYLQKAQKFGIDTSTFTRASLGLADADKTNINAQLSQTILESIKKTDSGNGAAQFYAKAGLSESDVAQALAGDPNAVKKYTEAAKTTTLPDLAELKNELDDTGKSAVTLGGVMNNYATTTGTVGDKQRELNEAINGSFRITEDAKKQFTDLGVAVQSVPDAKTIVIQDTTPEVQKHLQDLGFQVDHMQDGTIKLTANTDDASADIQKIATAPYVANVKVEVDPTSYKSFTQQLTVQNLQALHQDVTNVPVASGHSLGGAVLGPGTATSDSILTPLSNGEHVMTAAEVQALGGQGMTEQLRDLIRRGVLTPETLRELSLGPGRAGGGPIGQIVSTISGVASIFGASPSSSNAATPAIGGGAQTGLGAVIAGAGASLAQLGSAFQSAWKTSIGPGWLTVAAGIVQAKTAALDPAFRDIVTNVQGIGATVADTAQKTVTPEWLKMSQAIADGKKNSIDPAFSGIQDGLKTTVDSFAQGASDIGTQWQGIQEKTHAPVKWMVDNVFNAGIVGAWNSVATVVGAAPIPAFKYMASGGPVTGGIAGRDSVPTMLMPDEFVLSAAAVKAAGMQNLAAFNTAANRGSNVSTEGMIPIGKSGYSLPGLAAGGSGADAKTRILEAMRFAQSKSGLPYQWGGYGNPSFDCSGFMAAIAGQINGVPITSHPWGTETGGWRSQGFIPGLGGGFSIGILHGGEGGGHTAGTLGGAYGIPPVNVESGGMHGNVAYGGPAAGADNPEFTEQWHLPISMDKFVSAGLGATGDLGSMVQAMFASAMQGITSGVTPANQPGMFDGLSKAIVATAQTAGAAAIGKLAQSLSGSASGAGAEQWIPQIREALKDEGFPTSSEYIEATKTQIMTESSGNASAVQTVRDVNWPNNLAKGLVQVTPRTAAALGLASLGGNIFDPLTNLRLGMREIRSQHGGDLLGTWGHGHGYDSGGIIPPGSTNVYNGLSQPEALLNPDQWQSVMQAIALAVGIAKIPNAATPQQALATPAPPIGSPSGGPQDDKSLSAQDQTTVDNSGVQIPSSSLGGAEAATGINAGTLGDQFTGWAGDAATEILGEFLAPVGLDSFAKPIVGAATTGLQNAGTAAAGIGSYASQATQMGADPYKIADTIIFNGMDPQKAMDELRREIQSGQYLSRYRG